MLIHSELIMIYPYIVIYLCVVYYRMKEFSEWAQCQVLDLLRRYQPSSEDDLFDVLVGNCAYMYMYECYSVCHVW